VRGSPIIDVSIGKLTRFSTSFGDRPAATVMTWTWLGVRSGNASTLMLASDHAPPATSISVAAITATRKRNDSAINRSIMAASLA
jgi:hypothetical protein